MKLRKLGERVFLVTGESGGRYPDANGLLIRGSRRTMLIDAPLCVRKEEKEAVEQENPDLVVLSHCHEDHFPGLSLDFLSTIPCWVHGLDAEALASLDGLLELFGMPEPYRSTWAETVQTKFYFGARPDALIFHDRHQWDLGDVVVTALHTPGHTAGHCAFRVDRSGAGWSAGDAPGKVEAEVVFLGDIDLSGFGPYYGDAASSLEDFERSIEEISEWRSKWFVTGHHIGAVSQEVFEQRLANYRRRVNQREQHLMEFLSVPRDLDEMVAHRMVYRPQDEVAGADWIEARSIGLHLERLLERGSVSLEAGRYVVTDA